MYVHLCFRYSYSLGSNTTTVFFLSTVNVFGAPGSGIDSIIASGGAAQTDHCHTKGHVGSLGGGDGILDPLEGMLDPLLMVGFWKFGDKSPPVILFSWNPTGNHEDILNINWLAGFLNHQQGGRIWGWIRILQLLPSQPKKPTIWEGEMKWAQRWEWMVSWFT